MFEACALWIVKLIQGEMPALPDKVEFSMKISWYDVIAGDNGSRLGEMGGKEPSSEECRRRDWLPDWLCPWYCQVQIMMNMMMVTKFCYGSFLKVSYLKVSFSIMTKIQRDCGSDFPWDLDVGDMFKVLLSFCIHHQDGNLLKVVWISSKNLSSSVRSGTITRMKTSSPTETRALHQSSQVNLRSQLT